MKRKYRLNKEKFTEFLAGIGCAIIIEGAWLIFLLHL